MSKKKQNRTATKVLSSPSYNPNMKKDQVNLDEYPLISEEDQSVLKQFIAENPVIFPISFHDKTSAFVQEQKADSAWIQTYSGRKFNPLAPVEGAIVIQDIAHALAMLCRFTGHCKRFYSVAQHSVLVSYLCNHEDALHGLLHDASEAYLQDLPRPLKRSGKFENYKEYEHVLQSMIYERFGLDTKEPKSVKIADTLLLATEARDLMGPLHSDWKQPVEPLPMKIEPLGPAEAKNLFMKRFFELKGCPDQYDHYLKYDAIR